MKKLLVAVAVYAALLTGLSLHLGGQTEPAPIHVVGYAPAANVFGATTLTARNSSMLFFAEANPRATVVSSPAAGTQASASVAAETGVRHVIDCLSFGSQASGGASSASNNSVSVRDGATGVGTIIWTVNDPTIAGAAAGAQVATPINICGLNLSGSVNTALTVETLTGVANTAQTVSISFYNVKP